jgi:two-component sensor histidine kinase
LDVLRTVTANELAAQSGKLLPPRDTLALIDISVNPITAVSLGLALNAATVNSQAHGMAGNIAAALSNLR